jgi:PhnB protein
MAKAKVKAIPEGLHTITPHIVVEGAADAIAFYQKAFGAEEMMRAPDPSGKKIWHAVIRFGDASVFINDAFPDMGGGPKTIKLWLYSEDVDGVFMRAVEAGARVDMPPADMFWGDRMAQVVDRWGNIWALAQHTKDLTPEEMKKAQDEFVAQMKKP